MERRTGIEPLLPPIALLEQVAEGVDAVYQGICSRGVRLTSLSALGRLVFDLLWGLQLRVLLAIWRQEGLGPFRWREARARQEVA